MMRPWTYLLIIISYLMAGLLVYTASKKLMDYASYVAHVRDVAFLPKTWAVWAATAAIVVEYSIALMLLIPLQRINIWGWKAIVPLMMLYGYYVYHVQHKAPFTPCSCKGVDERLSWNQHFILAIGLLLLATLVIGLYNRKWIGKTIKSITHKIQ